MTAASKRTARGRRTDSCGGSERTAADEQRRQRAGRASRRRTNSGERRKWRGERRKWRGAGEQRAMIGGDDGAAAAGADEAAAGAGQATMERRQGVDGSDTMMNDAISSYDSKIYKRRDVFISGFLHGIRARFHRPPSHRLYGHVDGTTPAPPKFVNWEIKRTVVGNEAAGSTAENEVRIEYETVDNPEHELWMAHDQSLVAYITSTLSEEVLGSIDDDLTAMELWTTLATTYSQVSEARFLQLRRQFQDIKRGTRGVLEYLNEIKNVSDQLAAIGHPVSDKDKVQQALSGLGAEFDIFCTALEI
ncbi:hypothetical protein EJ110_NYTH59644 [Nymphaea thermarum]|nr:hypothetical protein EJ110_NYTH59644 [Nymphaea thermarum]